MDERQRRELMIGGPGIRTPKPILETPMKLVMGPCIGNVKGVATMLERLDSEESDTNKMTPSEWVEKLEKIRSEDAEISFELTDREYFRPIYEIPEKVELMTCYSCGGPVIADVDGNVTIIHCENKDCELFDSVQLEIRRP